MTRIEIGLRRTLMMGICLLWGCLSVVCAQQPKTLPDMASTFHTLRDNRIVYRQLHDSIYANMGEEAWLKFMERRSLMCKQMCIDNSRLISEVMDYFSQDSALIADTDYDQLFYWFDDMYSEDYGDIFLYEQFYNKLLPHYEAKADTTRLLTLHHIAGNCNAEIARSYEPEAAALAVAHYRANIEFGRHFATLDPKRSAVIPRNYNSLCYMLSALGAVSPSEAFEATNDFAHFLKQNESRFSAEDLEHYQDQLSHIRTTAFRIHADHNEGAISAKDSLALHKMYEASPFKQGGLAGLDCIEDSINYYHSLAFMGEMPFGDAYTVSNELLGRLFDQTEHRETITEDDILALSNSLLATFSLMEKCGFFESFMRQTVVYYTYRLVEYIQRARVLNDYTFFDYILAQLASEKTIIRHLPASMKEQFMSELAVKSQIGTVVHVSMVEHLCATLLDAFIDAHPEKFLGVMGCRLENVVLAKRKQMLQYMQMAALFHDLGKTQMAEIVGNEYRNLTEHEFAIIRKHPELSLNYLGLDPLFDKYKDVALGHHKWYDGQGGYPESFNNVASPWRIFIDILTVCDGIDAATDYLGRNYRVSKPLKEVVEEMKQGAGTRYNPDVIDLLLTDQNLFDRMNKLVIEERARQTSAVRQRYVHGTL